MSIFDLVTSENLTAYWTVLTQDEEPFYGETKFPNDKKRGLDLKWIKGAKGLPVVLKTSAFDAAAIPRNRQKFDKLSTEMPYFKESTYIDEELRQELNMVLETGNQAYIDSVMNRIFDDEMALIRSARVSRERMRMQALTTGVVSMTSNGQAFSWDYDVTHEGNAATSWSSVSTADPVEDIRLAKQEMLDEEGIDCVEAICSSKTMRYLRNNVSIKKSIYPLTNGAGIITDQMVLDFISSQVGGSGLTITCIDKRYLDETGTTTKYMPDDLFVLLPQGTLGKTWFGTTPAESDLMSSKVANVSVVDTGVAITTVQKADPVNVETIVSMICLPSFEQADKIYILDTDAEAAEE